MNFTKKKLNNIAIIPARFASKRIKNKNIKLFRSKPIIKWTFNILQKSKIFDEIFVSTESKKIYQKCKKIGIKKFIKRPKKLSNDFVGTDEVIKSAIEELSKKYELVNVCCVYPCAVFLTIKDLKEAKKIINHDKKRFVYPITEFPSPIERALKIKKKNIITKVNKRFFNKRTQDLNKKYYDAGQFYFSNKLNWLKKNNRINIGIKIPGYRAVDIDYPDDWKKAELLFNKIKN